jgi:hypothetical protein
MSLGGVTMYWLNIPPEHIVFGSYNEQKPKTKPPSNIVNRTTQLLITSTAEHEEYK